MGPWVVNRRPTYSADHVAVLANSPIRHGADPFFFGWRLISPDACFPPASIGLWRALTIVIALAAATLTYTPTRYTGIA